jgi:hypothetical protein
MKRIFRMNLNLLRVLKGEEGVSAIFVALMLPVFIGLSGLAVESGHVYYAYQELINSTNAATLAAAQSMPNVTLATSNATAYSSVTGKRNATPLLANVTLTPTLVCSSLLSGSSSLNLACLPASDGGKYNAIKVKQSADVSTWLIGLFGVKKFHMSYTSAASVRGGANSPWNIAIIMDATSSMSSSDSGVQCTGTRESCALKGVQALLANLYPCYLGQNCSSGNGAYVDAVALITFPPASAATYTYDYCSGGSPSNVVNNHYVLPSTGSPDTSPGWPRYIGQITRFSNDYKTDDSASTLYTSSKIVKATGYSGTSCAGIYPKGGTGTYYAQAIKEAQAALVAQQNNNQGSRNAIILLGDGDMSASVTYNSGHTALTTSSQIQASSTNSVNGVSFHNPTSPTYPSAVGQCGQAVQAAKDAADAGTRVYAIAYGAATSGCSTDATYSSSVTTGGGSWAKGKSPCQALAAIASSTDNFYSDNVNGCKATLTTNQNFTTLTAIFRQIVAGLTTPRLVTLGMISN